VLGIVIVKCVQSRGGVPVEATGQFEAPGHGDHARQGKVPKYRARGAMLEEQIWPGALRHRSESTKGVSYRPNPGGWLDRRGRFWQRRDGREDFASMRSVPASAGLSEIRNSLEEERSAPEWKVKGHGGR